MVTSSVKNMRIRQMGLSLVELMIATVLGLLIVAALTQLFADVTRANREMAKTNSQIENARYAMQLLRNDIVHAGYWGPHVPEFDDLMYSQVPVDTPTIIPDPCLALGSWTGTAGHVDSLLGIPVQSYTGSPSAACNAVLNGELTTAGTDVLVVRHADTCPAGTTNCAADTAGPLYFQASNCLTEIEAGNLYSRDPTSYTLTERDCATQADKRLFVQNIYFIKNNANGIPSLYRSEYGLSGGTNGQMTAQELVPGVERFRVELGVDSLSETGAAVDYTAAVDWEDPKVWTVATNRGDGVPDGPFVHCTSSGTAPCTVANMTNVVAVKIYILARADEPSPGYTDTKTYQLGGLNLAAFNDNYKRHVFSTTVRINNVSGRRETP